MINSIEENHYNNKVSVGIVRNDSGKVLIIRRKQKVSSITGGTLLWTFPSCAVPHDTSNEDMISIIEEKTLKQSGYTIRVMDKISERKYHPFNNHLFYFHCTLLSNDSKGIHPDAMVEEYAWVDVSELEEYFTTNVDLGVRKFLGM